MSEKSKLFATSLRRYNGGVRVKRAWGSSTVTTFLVGFRDRRPDTWMEIDAYGATPGERKIYAIDQYLRRSGAKE